MADCQTSSNATVRRTPRRVWLAIAIWLALSGMAMWHFNPVAAYAGDICRGGPPR